MGSTPLAHITAFLTYLNSAPHPDHVARALVDGPGADLDARAGALAWAHDDVLVFAGVHGYLDQELGGLQTISLDHDRPMSRAFHDSEILVDDADEVEARYRHSGAPGSRWPAIRARLAVRTVVSAPIISSGVAVGSYTLHSTDTVERVLPHLPTLRAVSAALGLWLTHPDSGIPVASAGSASTGVDDVALTRRQLRILQLLSAGKTTSSIAATLAVSASTVKQEVQRVSRQLGTSDRAGAVRRARELGLVEDPRP